MRSWLLSIALAVLSAPVWAHENPRPIPSPALDDAKAAGDSPTMVLSGGCYWGMQEVFEHVKGVKQVVAGFSGQPMVSGEDHRFQRPPSESVEITYDPGQITYGRLLQIFFSVAHDPTEVDRQGPDVGPQYRSEIYFSTDRQKQLAESYIAQLEAAHAFAAPITTRVESLARFRNVDTDQQDYAIKHPASAYIVIVDEPKLVALKGIFPNLYLDAPTTVAGR